MSAKIPGSSLKFILVSLHVLFFVSLILGIALYSYGFVAPEPGQIPWTVNKFGIIPILFLLVAYITTFPITIADILALKRERLKSVQLACVIVSLVIFGFASLLVLSSLIISIIGFLS